MLSGVLIQLVLGPKSIAAGLYLAEGVAQNLLTNFGVVRLHFTRVFKDGVFSLLILINKLVNLYMKTDFYFIIIFNR